MDWLNQNAGAMQALSTIVLVLITGIYVWLTRSLAKASHAQIEPKLTLQAMIAGIYPPEPGRKHHLALTLTNAGLRPIRVTNILGESATPGGGYLFKAKEIPKLLAEAENHVELFDPESLDNPDLINILAVDSTERRWKLGRKAFKRLRQDWEAVKRREGA